MRVSLFLCIQVFFLMLPWVGLLIKGKRNIYQVLIQFTDDFIKHNRINKVVVVDVCVCGGGGVGGG